MRASRSFFSLLALLTILLGGTWAQARSGTCRSYYLPVDYPGVPEAKLYGELCLPWGQAPQTVQFLVHGSTYNHHYWDFPWLPELYSHVEAALEAGYATFNIDRIGTGLSTKPLSYLVTVDGTIASLHQAIQKLRNGQIGGHAFSRVVYFGSSLSTAYGWVLASRYPEDVDAFIFTGLIHHTQQHWYDLIAEFIYPANLDPKFAALGLDDGYITTRPGARDDFFYQESNSGPIVPWVDDLLKGEVSGPLMFESASLVTYPDPETSPSQDIEVPTLIAFSEFDGTACGTAPDAIVCTEESVREFEAPFYPDDIVLDVYVPQDTGHAQPLHFSGPSTADFIHDWLDEQVGAN